MMTLRGMARATAGGIHTIGKGRALEWQSRGGEEGYHFSHDHREDLRMCLIKDGHLFDEMQLVALGTSHQNVCVCTPNTMQETWIGLVVVTITFNEGSKAKQCS